MYLIRCFENRRCRWQIDLQVRREVIGSQFQGDESARTRSTLMKNTGASERHRRIRYDRLNIEERNRALCGVLPPIGRCEVQVLIFYAVRYVRHGMANRYVGLGKFQLGSKSKNILLINSGTREIKSQCMLERKSHLLVMSLLCQKLFSSG